MPGEIVITSDFPEDPLGWMSVAVTYNGHTGAAKVSLGYQRTDHKTCGSTVLTSLSIFLFSPYCSCIWTVS